MLRKGGNGGQIRPCDEKEWKYFPSIGLHSHSEKEKNNRNVFTNVNAVKDSRMQQDTRRICDLKNIESSFNKQCTCFCFTNHILEDVINYCCSIDKTYEKLREMKNRYKLNEKWKIIISGKCLGIATTVEVSCSRCKEKAIVDAVPSKFKGNTL